MDFEKELEICKKQNKKNRGHCKWGKCAECGVIPLIYKLNNGIILEDQDEIDTLKKNILK